MAEVNLPKGWCLSRLSDIATKGEQRTPNASEEFIYVDIGSINRDLKIIQTPQKLLGGAAPSRARKVINSGDVLVSLTRPNLNAVALVPDELNEQIASTGFEVIKPLIVDGRYVFALTRSKHFIDAISGAVQGALYPAAKSSDVQGYEFPLPPLAEQKVIAEKLDTLLVQVDNTKARLERIPEILKRFRQSVLAAAVSGKLTEEWRSGRQFKTSSEELSRLAKFIDYRGKTPTKTDSGIPLITAKNIRPGFISREPREFIAHEDYESWMTRGIPNFGDVLITTEAPMGYVANIDIEEKFALAQRAICLQFSANMNPYFASIYMQASEFQKALDENATGSTVKGIKAALLKKIQITYPSKDEQTEIVRRVEELFAFADRIEHASKAALSRVNNLTQSILAKAFRGELTLEWRAANPELISGEHSAEALLARIKAERAALGAKPKKSKG